MSKLDHEVRWSDLGVCIRRPSDPKQIRRRPLATARCVKGFLGVLVDTLDHRELQGVRVVGTVAGSTAARIGLATGDTITSFGGMQPASAIALGNFVSTCHPGQHVDLTWTTPQGSAHFANVRLSREPLRRTVPARRTLAE